MVRIGHGPGAISPAKLRADPRRRRQVWISIALIAALGLVLMTWSITAAYLREAPLRGDGLVSVQAEVLAFTDHGKTPDQVKVRYEVPGRSAVIAEINVTEPFRAGTTTVLYDPADPTTVRTATAWRPSYTPPRLLYPLAAATVLGIALTRARAAHLAGNRTENSPAA